MNIEVVGLDPDAVADPCGILPFYFPTDLPVSIESRSVSSMTLISQAGVFRGPKRYRFAKNGKPQWLDVTSQRFSNWMVR